ncbi:hypothetical protein [Arthrobacter sp. H14]|uniref:hypothetical protein n=1 Tax=Arthrobacter sp. H14 TaxID=1312959 RepID=UPI00047C11D3|nr:hypothetical protein [Arthrobacter sp. H14]
MAVGGGRITAGCKGPSWIPLGKLAFMNDADFLDYVGGRLMDLPGVLAVALGSEIGGWGGGVFNGEMLLRFGGTGRRCCSTMPKIITLRRAVWLNVLFWSRAATSRESR